jgi:hypothetical protein
MTSPLSIFLSLDETTEFLKPIYSSIVNGGFSNIDYFELAHPIVDLAVVYERVEALPKDTTLIFLGHGSSYSIYQPINGNDSAVPLINRNNFHILSNRKFICLSCRSREFIGANFVYESEGFMLGFENIPTHWGDIAAEREVDSTAYAGVSESVLDSFRSILVQTFSEAILDTLINRESLQFFCLRLKLRINKMISEVILNGKSDSPSSLADILFEFKSGMRSFGDSSISL